MLFTQSAKESLTNTLDMRLLPLVAVTCIYLLYLHPRSPKALLLPLGPKGGFITGNLPEVLAAVQKRQQHLLFNRWGQQHGKIVRVRSGLFVQYFINPLESKGEAMPGVADKRMPVSLRVVSEEKESDIEAASKRALGERDDLEPLVHTDGTGGFERLPFVKVDDL